jgi:hypothetical protein
VSINQLIELGKCLQIHPKNKIDGLSEVSWENQQQIEEKVKQVHELEQQQRDQQIRNSSSISHKTTKRRQSSLAEFMWQ